MTKPGLNSVGYFALLAAGLTTVGGIFADGKITSLRIYLAAVACIATVMGVLAAAHAAAEAQAKHERLEADSRRTHEHLETVLRSMDLPDFIVEKIDKKISEFVRSRDWRLERTTRTNDDRCILFFKKSDNVTSGVLHMLGDEYKRIWIMNESDRDLHLESRIFGREPAEPDLPEQNLIYIEELIQFIVFQGAVGEISVSLEAQEDGSRLFTFREEGDEDKELVLYSKARQIELDAMIPIVRFAMIEKEVRTVYDARRRRQGNYLQN